MTFSQALYLIESSTQCFIVRIGGVGTHIPWPMLTVEELSQYEMCGGRTVALEESIELRFSVDKNNFAICEDPDKVAGKFRRWSFNVDLFMGDEHGYIIQRHGSTHSVLLKRLEAVGIWSPATRQVVPGDRYSLPPDIVIIGDPKNMKFEYSGVILGRQFGVDATYISCWTKHVDETKLTRWCFHEYDPPFKLEKPIGDNIIGGSFTISDLHLRPL